MRCYPPSVVICVNYVDELWFDVLKKENIVFVE